MADLKFGPGVMVMGSSVIVVGTPVLSMSSLDVAGTVVGLV